MNLVKCDRGHYYDGDKFDTCPHCQSQRQEDLTVSTQVERTEGLDVTEPTNEVSSASITKPLDSDKTIGFYAPDDGDDKYIEPVVGWLVAIDGNGKGKSYTLKVGKNFIGRNSHANDVVLNEDNSVSREKHAIIAFDPKSCFFHAQPGMSSELFYVNDNVVLQPVQIVDRDIISIGKTKLMFIAFCTSEYSWESF